jgi:hypothetical protein
MSNPDEYSYCSACKTNKCVADFRLKGNGATHNKTCITCSKRTKQKRKEDKENPEKFGPDSQPGEDGSDLGSGLDVLSLTDFLGALMEQDEILELAARVDISSLLGSRRDRANNLAAKVWKRMKYRFVYVQCSALSM